MNRFVDSVFNETVFANESTEFEGCVFAMQGTSKKDQNGLGLVMGNSADVSVKKSTFKNQGYSAIGLRTSGKVVIEDNVFECDKIYNPIEGTVSAGDAVADVVIKDNTFNGVCGNNYINFYKMADGAVVEIEGNNVTGASRNSEILRLSNVENSSATFNVKDNNYTFTSGEVSDYTSFIMCQDFTAKSGKPEDFSKYTVNIENLRCAGQPVGADFDADGVLYFVYEDNKGIITGSNDPVINIK